MNTTAPWTRHIGRLAVSITLAFGLVSAAAGAEPCAPRLSLLRDVWWSDVLMAKQARLAAASDQELIAELKSADWVERFDLAKEMSRRNAAVFAASWRPFLAGENPLDRCLAGLVLARAGKDQGLDVVLRELAASTAELQNLPALRDQQQMLHSEYWSRTQDAWRLQYIATLVLGLIGDPRAVNPLIEATRDLHSASEAAKALGEIGDRRAIPALREMVRLLPSERHWAGWALARLGEPEGFELLIDVARSDLGWDQRRHAILALGGLRYRGAVEPLVKLLRDPNVHLRVAAARALGQIGDPAALPGLRAALDDQTRTTQNEDVSVSEIARKAMERLEAAVEAKPLAPCGRAAGPMVHHDGAVETPQSLTSIGLAAPAVGASLHSGSGRHAGFRNA
jgi:HEAT repeat protein